MRVKILYNPHSEQVNCMYRGEQYSIPAGEYIKLLTSFDEEAAKYWKDNIHNFLVIKTVNLDENPKQNETSNEETEREEVEPQGTSESGETMVAETETQDSEEDDTVDESMKRDELDAIALTLSLNPSDYINKKELADAINETKNGKS